MDWEAFERDVWESVNNSLYREQFGDVQCDEIVITIGETWQGTLYGAEENVYGQRCVYMFDTEEEQRQWYDAVAASAHGFDHEPWDALIGFDPDM